MKLHVPCLINRLKIQRTEMPLVVFSGYPSSGKTTWTRKLAEYLETEKGKSVHIVREEDNLQEEKNDILDGR